jgi:hypothetical protein
MPFLLRKRKGTGLLSPACLNEWTSTQCLSCSRWSPHCDWYVQTRSRAAANPVLLPKAKPRATGLALIMPPIRSREVDCVQRSRVGHREDALQSLDFGNGLRGVHSVPISNMGMAIVNGAAFACRACQRNALLRPQPKRAAGFLDKIASDTCDRFGGRERYGRDNNGFASERGSMTNVLFNFPE